MSETKLKYLDDSYVFEAVTKVDEIGDWKDRDGNLDGRKVVFLDQTIFYPQGGGQPYDQGQMVSENGEVFTVEEVRFSNGDVYHIGKFESSEFESGQKVKLSIDEGRRRLNAKYHSGGHLIDVAINKFGYDWKPGKGNHFPGEAFVQYEGSLDPEKYEEFKEKLETEINKMIQEGYACSAKIIDQEELKTLKSNFEEYMLTGKPIRVVDVYGPLWIPCGGTHVHNINEIKSETIIKVSSKKGRVTVRYEVI